MKLKNNLNMTLFLRKLLKQMCKIWKKLIIVKFPLKFGIKWKRQINSKLQISKEFDKLNNFFEKEEPNLPYNTFNKVVIPKKLIISLICDALKEHNLTTFDFYSEFINQYHLKQIVKQKNLGKSINIDSLLHDIQYYSIKLAKTMSQKQLTQVQYKQKGLLFKEEEEEEWLNEFFDDDVQNGTCKKDIRSCSLVQKKGPNFSFVHKSIQEFLVAVDLNEVLVLSKDLNLKILSSIIGWVSKEQIQDSLNSKKSTQNLTVKPFDRPQRSHQIIIYIFHIKILNL